ncbi:MAG TPA: hypothetical protein VHJ18_09155 [Streptosporangiaceae bacterium]|nr:hypothetical protein [Streptosporangiaceae bacterium]
MLGIPDRVQACLFDLDGVLTQTAKVHATAWKETFDAYLRALAERTSARFVPFDAVADYDTYVDGKPRADGIQSFLGSRGIELPVGCPGRPERRGDGIRAGQERMSLCCVRSGRTACRRMRARSGTCVPCAMPG